jgi:hypothetical protein
VEQQCHSKWTITDSGVKAFATLDEQMTVLFESVSEPGEYRACR